MQGNQSNIQRLSRTDSSKPWSEFDIQVPRVVRQLFEVATTSIVGDGASTFFWLDKWLPGGRVKELTPNLFLKVPKSARSSRLVREGLAGGWLEDIPPDLNALEIAELMALAAEVADFALTDGVVDEFRWNLEGNRKYSARSAYKAFFHGKIGMAGAQQIWCSRAPNKCKFFLWLALKHRCWTADAYVVEGCLGRTPALYVDRKMRTLTTFFSAVWSPERCGTPS